MGSFLRSLIVGITAVFVLVAGHYVTSALDAGKSVWIVGALVLVAVVAYVLQDLWKSGTNTESPGARSDRGKRFREDLRGKVRSRSYNARRELISSPLDELTLEMSPKAGFVRAPSVDGLEPIPATTDIVKVFKSSEHRLLIVGEPGSGKTMAAYRLVEYLDDKEGAERVPLLVNVSAWEGQDSFEAFLIDYLVSSVGYEEPRRLAEEFVKNREYSLVLDGLDEIPPALREGFCECLDGFLKEAPRQVAVVVTCRTRVYRMILEGEYHKDGLGLVGAVEVRPLSDRELDFALVKLYERRADQEGWEKLLSEPQRTECRRVRRLLSKPLFLNLTVEGGVTPDELLNCDDEKKLPGLVIKRYIDHTLLKESGVYEPADIRHYLTWIARFLNRTEMSPFGCKASDPTVFDLADLTPPKRPKQYGVLLGLSLGIFSGLGLMPILGLSQGLFAGLVLGLGGAQTSASAVSSRLISMRQLRQLFKQESRNFLWAPIVGGALGLFLILLAAVLEVINVGFDVVLGIQIGNPIGEDPIGSLIEALIVGLVTGLGLALVGLVSQLRSSLLTSRNPKDIYYRSLSTALLFTIFGLIGGSSLVLFRISDGFSSPVVMVFAFILLAGLSAGLHNGGWFVFLQKVAHRRLSQDGKLPQNPYGFLEWGVKKHIFRPVGGGVRFRHDLIKHHLEHTS